MDDLLTQGQADELLEPLKAGLHDAVQRAWARWLKNPDAATARKVTRANTVYDYMTQEVQEEFASTEGVTFTWSNQSLVMTVKDTAIIKFKKFRGPRLRTSGISTNARNRFLEQADVLDGMAVTHLVVGYLLDELEIGTSKIAVSCPLGDGNYWTLPLGPETVEEQPAPVVPIEVTPPAETGITIRSTKVVASDDTAVNEE